MRHVMLPVVLLASLGACGSATTGPGGAPGTGTDAAAPTDTGAHNPVDTSLTVADGTVPPSVDGGSPVDVPPGTDGGPPPLDVISPPVDVPEGVDVPPPPPLDGGVAGSLAGRWRVVDWLYTSPEGMVTHLTDHDTTVIPPGSGMPVPVRVNGILTLSPTRFSLAFGSQANGHFYVINPPPPTTGDNSDYSATGFTVPGLLDDTAGTFTIPGGGTVITFTRNADGTITLTTPGSGARTTLARVVTPPPPVTSLNLLGYVQLRTATMSLPFVHPRAAVLWDHPAAGATVETNATALTLAMGGGVLAVVQTSPPPTAAVGTEFGVSIAVGYPFVYDDVNNNNRWDGAPDIARGFGPVAIVWRGAGTPTAGWETSPFADTVAGYQMAHLHQDLFPAGHTLSPFDTSNTVSPDVPVTSGALLTPAPHLVL